MSIHDYLVKQLEVENAVVTFRLLSREKRIHVSAAKQELEKYKARVDSVFATYLITGSLRRIQYEFMDMDRDEAFDFLDKDSDCVEEVDVQLVGEDMLEDAKSQFSDIHSVHVYSLSPARLLDPDLICLPNEKVRKLDTANTNVELGRVIGPHVILQAKTAKGKGKLAAPAPLAVTASLSKLKVSPKEEEVKEKSAEKEKPKPSTSSGKLDWSKAKSKEDIKKEKEEKAKDKEAKFKEKEDKLKEKEAQQKKKAEEAGPKRGVKRKTAALSISEPSDNDEPVVAAKPQGVRLKKGVVLSDDDEDEPKPKKSKSKSKPKAKFEESDNERSLREMMDIDDDEVEKVSRKPKRRSPTPEEEEEPDALSYAEEEEEEVIKPKPRKRKEKKVIPIGSNGLPKKKILKSRMKTDEKGYMVTEDYSSYESVDENAAEEEPESDAPAKKGTAKAKAKAKQEPKAKPKPKASSSNLKESKTTGSAKDKKISGSSSKAGGGGLMNFFEKKT